MSNNYKRNYLSNVIFKIDFPPILKLANEPPKEFQESIKSNFPILEELPQEGVEFANLQGEIGAKKLRKTIWKFYSKDKNKFLELDERYLIVNFLNHSYKNFDDFIALVSAVFDSFNEIYQNTIFERVGLRYINEFKIEEETDFYDWNGYINESLINFLEFTENKADLKRSINSFLIKTENDSILNFKYGLFNSSFPGDIVSKEFILDYDCFYRALIEKDSVIRLVTDNNKTISDYFEKSIDSKMRLLLS